MTTTRVDGLEDGVTDGCRSSELSLTGEDREKVELLDDMIVLDRASVDIAVVKVDVVEVVVENVVEMEEDPRCGKHAFRGPNKGQGPRLNASEPARRPRMIGKNFILTCLSEKSKAIVRLIYRRSFD